MISNDVLQAALVARLKAQSTVTGLLNGATEIREQQWQGRNFDYPAVRVNLRTQVPLIPRQQCEWSRLSFSIYCLSEEKSSKEADELAGAVNAALNRTAWTVSSDGFRFFFVRSSGLNSAIRMSERVWRAEPNFLADIHTI
jgi:hypothetical protein